MPWPSASRRRALLRLLRVLLLEAIDAAGRVDQLLLAGEERMALRADLDAQLFLGGVGGPGLAAGAMHLDLVILGMDLCFHEFEPRLDKRETASIAKKFWSSSLSQTHQKCGL